MKGRRSYGLLAAGAVTLLSGGCAPDRIVASPDGPAAGSSLVSTAPTRAGSPLVILDGHRLASEALRTIDPNDIASVEVLKGEAAAVLYGDAGSNGVIIIKTKRAGAR